MNQSVIFFQRFTNFARHLSSLDTPCHFIGWELLLVFQGWNNTKILFKTASHFSMRGTGCTPPFSVCANLDTSSIHFSKDYSLNGPLIYCQKLSDACRKKRSLETTRLAVFIRQGNTTLSLINKIQGVIILENET